MSIHNLVGAKGEHLVGFELRQRPLKGGQGVHEAPHRGGLELPRSLPANQPVANQIETSGLQPPIELQPLQLRIVAKASLGTIPFLGWHLRRTGHLLVDRKNPGAAIVQKMRRLVSESHSLIVFPEGTRSADGSVDRFKKGSFLVAIDAKLPVVPVSITGSRHIMTKGRLMVCPGDVQLIIHAPISTADVKRTQVIGFGERVREIVIRGVTDREAAARDSSPAEVR